jgi:ferredoxin
VINLGKYKIEINREDCIACGTCYSLDTEHFESDEEGKGQVINGQTDEKTSIGTFTDDNIAQAQEAEDNCPVSVISVTES